MKTISITCIDARDYYPTLRALESTLKCIPNVTSVYWFSDIPMPMTQNVPVTFTYVKRFEKYTDEYNYVTLKLCPEIVKTDYNIIIHADGYAVNAGAWTDEFLNYDYIGAVWPWHQNNRVGNGGFSLRSRKLYDALQSMDVMYKSSDYSSAVPAENFNIDMHGDRVIPEDNIICRYYRDALERVYKIRFAPDHIADRFSIEHNMSSPWLGSSLGFHGKHGIANNYGVTL